MNGAHDRPTIRRAAWLGGGLVALALVALVVFLVVGARDAPSETSGGNTAAPTPAGSSAAPQPPDSTASNPPDTDPTTATPDPTSTAPNPTTVPPSPTEPYTPPEMAPVGLDSPSERESGVVVSLDSIEAVDGEAHLPGEVAAPALRFTIVIRNDSAADIDLATVVVNGYSGEERTPLETLASPGGEPFSGVLEPGEQARGVYLFAIAPADRGDVTITVDLEAGQAASVFRGDATG